MLKEKKTSKAIQIVNEKYAHSLQECRRAKLNVFDNKIDKNLLSNSLKNKEFRLNLLAAQSSEKLKKNKGLVCGKSIFASKYNTLQINKISNGSPQIKNGKYFGKQLKLSQSKYRSNISQFNLNSRKNFNSIKMNEAQLRTLPKINIQKENQSQRLKVLDYRQNFEAQKKRALLRNQEQAKRIRQIIKRYGE